MIGQESRSLNTLNTLSENHSKFNDTTAAYSLAVAEPNCMEPEVDVKEQFYPSYSGQKTGQKTGIMTQKVQGISINKSWVQKRQTSHMLSDDVVCASISGCEEEDHEKMQQELLGRWESHGGSQESKLKSWKIIKLPREQELKFTKARHLQTGTKNLFRF